MVGDREDAVDCRQLGCCSAGRRLLPIRLCWALVAVNFHDGHPSSMTNTYLELQRLSGANIQISRLLSPYTLPGEHSILGYHISEHNSRGKNQ